MFARKLSINQQRNLLAIGIPITVVFLQWLLLWIGNQQHSFKDIGITFASIGMGQIFPFIAFENVLIAKLFAVSESTKTNKSNKIITSYSMIPKVNEEKEALAKIRYSAILIFIIVLLLFLATVGLCLKDLFVLHLATGVGACFLSWYFIVTDFSIKEI